MSRVNEHDGPAREAYDFDVKEQDRWLPIANGRFYKSPCLQLPKAVLQLWTKVEKHVESCLRGYCLVFCDRCKSLRLSGGKSVACEKWQGT